MYVLTTDRHENKDVGAQNEAVETINTIQKELTEKTTAQKRLKRDKKTTSHQP